MRSIRIEYNRCYLIDNFIFVNYVKYKLVNKTKLVSVEATNSVDSAVLLICDVWDIAADSEVIVNSNTIHPYIVGVAVVGFVEGIVDDIDGHFFDPKSYPEIDYYVEWANNNKLKWLIENNIFIAKTKIIRSELCIR